ncbi:type II toxin-antitoxin system death-on-curing family toxin [Candidatus Nitronereus thalassa]|uniref:Type II toxin-antitoxin system death-on-curing family toxin n=1 Tax=Candidatus Nitronereus thalassa TaxID=3020898 RepID=A0ABU3KAJ7_9BACT|nr:type II toxin-antitoxin system death-on-curing family toxin [Candidatus Nitronereus thalassa]MDT7043510.1 type II toxin-antitoxin system death-on-curing family toxin [Candidatus Nitronereus thalassa]
MKEPAWVLHDFVLALHEDLLSGFGGASGIRDGALLESALARPHQLFAYEKPDLFILAASYISGLVRNHPFIDGNKRTAFMVGYSFLSRNGKELNAPEPEATAVIVDLAPRKITEEDLAMWLRQNCE